MNRLKLQFYDPSHFISRGTSVVGAETGVVKIFSDVNLTPFRETLF